MGYANVSGSFRVAAEPELKQIGTSRSVLKLRVRATNRTPKNAPATSMFFDVEVWGDLAENAAPLLSKGTEVMIQGRLQEDEWEKEVTCEDCGAVKKEKRRKFKVTATDIGVAVSRWSDADDTGFRPTSSQQARVIEEAF